MYWGLFKTATYTASTGLVDFPFSYTCAHCGVQASGRARTEGFSSVDAYFGADVGAEATWRANVHAGNSAQSVATMAGCPSCGRLQPAALAKLGDDINVARWKLRLRAPAAIFAGCVTCVGMVAVSMDAEATWSLGLLLFIVGSTLAAFGGVFAGLSLREETVQHHRDRVWFWWTLPPSGSAYRDPMKEDWVPAPVPLDLVPLQASRLALATGLIAVGLGCLTDLIAFVLWVA